MLNVQEREAITCVYSDLRRSGYDNRRSQREMIGAVGTALASSSPLIIEGPTGVGKSHAYLIPALSLAVERDVPVVISTATLALMEQLASRDVPHILAYLGIEPDEVVQVKGRGRYVCPEALDALHAQSRQVDAFAAAEFPDGLDSGKLLAYATSRKYDITGYPDPLPSAVRKRVTMEGVHCRGAECPQFFRCHYPARQRAIKKARVLLTNHQLLVADKEHRARILPQDAFYIIDEAHHLPEVAQSQTVREVAFNSAASAIEALYDELKDRHWFRAVREMSELPGIVEALRRWHRSLAARRMLVGDSETTDMTDMAKADCSIASGIGGLVRIVRPELAALVDGDAAPELFVGRLRHAASLLDSAEEICEDFSYPNRPGIARWFFGTKKGMGAARALLDVSERLSRFLPDQTVFTSATLADGNGLGRFARRVGKATARCVELDSPFDLYRQGTLLVPSYAGDPRESGHTARIVRAIEEAVRPGQGVLCLLSSWASLDQVVDSLGGLKEQVSVQGMGALEEHADRVGQGRASILLGLRSYGEGLDLPGALCTTVVVGQLPFAAPGDPIAAATEQALMKQGRSAFREVMLPDAILRLRQMIGRLIRSRTDEGTCVILDARLVTARYGEHILAALPGLKRQIEYKIQKKP